MTGFARSEGHRGSYSWHWEIRTVNGRGLDVRVRLPQGFEALEQIVRQACKKRLARGNCSITLAVSKETGATHVCLNEDILKQVMAVVNRASELTNAPPPNLDVLLAMRGVIEFTDQQEDEPESDARQNALLDDFGNALDAVIEARADEGEHLETEISKLLVEIEGRVKELEDSPARSPDAIGKRLREQLQRIFDQAPQIDEDRIYQEVALIAVKADIEEEISRLRAHLAAARVLLDSSDPIGRKFDFLTQEFNREANTICSKSNDTDITQSGLAIKATIDRLREQVQNIE